MPYFEKVEMLRNHVNQLVEERTILEAEEHKLSRRRLFRTRMVLSSIKYRRSGTLQMHWAHWKNLHFLTMQQHTAIIDKLRKMREIPLINVFKGWRAAAVRLKLVDIDRTAAEIKMEMTFLKTELGEAQAVEAKLTKAVDSLSAEELQLKKFLLETKRAIEKQRVSETMNLIKAVAEAAMMMGNATVDIIDPLFRQIEESPSYQKIALMFFSFER